MNTVAIAVTLTAALLMSAGCSGGAHIISPFGSGYGAEGYPRVDGPHNGIDVAGMVGEPVLAAADGSISFAQEKFGNCGTVVMIRHDDGFQTMYCHLRDFVKDSGAVRRGEVIGHLGTTGRAPGRGYEHVHFSLKSYGTFIDPMTKISGCFEAGKVYPEQLTLTYPVQCKN